MACNITTGNFCFLYDATLPAIVLPFEDMSSVSDVEAEVRIGERSFNKGISPQDGF
ncbi:hypothetical protein ACF3N7_05450 [Cruoricaptor ignavus]|uniref:hypothetical protein n=1 Tax=Cruoricaptor ignavus TaxID=1118202 RepID=UPI00370DB2DF